MDVKAAYGKSTAQQGWTRVDMLLEVYDSLVRELKAAIASCETDDTPALATNRLKILNHIMVIEAGIDLEKGGEVAQNIVNLSDYVRNATLGGKKADLESSLNVICELQEAFQSIREQAIQMEHDGTIPPLELRATFDSRL